MKTPGLGKLGTQVNGLHGYQRSQSVCESSFSAMKAAKGQEAVLRHHPHATQDLDGESKGAMMQYFKQAEPSKGHNKLNG